MEIIGEKVLLVPISESEKDWFFDIATKSDGSVFWYGENCGDPVPDRKTFFKDFKDHYFDGSALQEGRAYVIITKGTNEKIGVVNYNKIENHSTEFDIIIGAKEHFGKGYGRDTLTHFFQFLKSTFEINKIILEVLGTNARAIFLYEKLGFKKIGTKHKKDIEWVLMEADI